MLRVNLGDVVVILKSVISEHVLWIKFMSASYEIALRWKPLNTFDVKQP